MRGFWSAFQAIFWLLVLLMEAFTSLMQFPFSPSARNSSSRKVS